MRLASHPQADPTSCCNRLHSHREGNIPHELGQLPRLKRLRLNNNNLSGRTNADGMGPLLEYPRCLSRFERPPNLFHLWVCE